ncbi:hypothetical protein LCGC14_1287870 [marine sediment metagenome]|uniref:Uncharacterized protein n=1 Tax=marine sediment metagenome TaxID=412755 RepID=A0A0F9LEA2_9ZZZZ
MFLLEAAKPKIKVYRPQKQGDRWLLRADIEIAGERIELQANASAGLSDRARSWYNQAAARFAESVGYDKHGIGVFADVPSVASAMGYAPVVPRDHDISEAARLYFAGGQGDPEAEQLIEDIYARAWRDPEAQNALDCLMLIESAMFERDRLDMGDVMMDAAGGSPHAQRVLAALYQVSTAGEPTRLSWWIDDYVQNPRRMVQDLTLAAGDEIYARLVSPVLKLDTGVRRVSPGLPPMSRTWGEIQGGWR